MFDAAVIARTLYAGLGPGGWKLVVLGLGSKPPTKFVVEARLPVPIVQSYTVFGALPTSLPKPVLVVDPKGEPAWNVNVETPFTLVVDYTGSLRPSLGGYIPVSSLGSNMLTYEAIAVIYELLVSRRERNLVEPSIEGLSVREALYLARKLLEALTIVDSYYHVDVNAVAYALRNVLLGRGLLADLENAVLEYEPAGPQYTYRLRVALYSVRGLEKRGHVEAVIDLYNGFAEFRGPGFHATFALDAEAGTVCVDKGLCIGKGEEQAETQIPPGWLP